MPDFDPTERELSSHFSAAAAHPSLQLLLAAGQGVLQPEVEARVQAHLQGCALCALLLKDMATLPEATLSPAQEQRMLGALPANAPGTPVLRRLVPVLSAVAALVLLSVGGFFYTRKHAAERAQTVATTQQRSAPAAVAVAEVEIPLLPLAPPVGELQTRGGGSQNPSVETLLPAFNAYNKGDYAAAELRFTPLLASYPRSEVVPLYLGVSRLYLGKNQQAYDALTLARHNAEPAALPAAEWYAAIAAQRLHRPEVRALLTNLCKGPATNYTAQSCRIASTLP